MSKETLQRPTCKFATPKLTSLIHRPASAEKASFTNKCIQKNTSSILLTAEGNSRFSSYTCHMQNIMPSM